MNVEGWFRAQKKSGVACLKMTLLDERHSGYS
jgi:hypothetical protein